MPPLVPRKRLRSSRSPTPSTGDSRTKKTKRTDPSPSYPRRKPTLYDDLDACATTGSKDLLSTFGDQDSASSLSSLSDDDFEDVPLAKHQDNDAPRNNDAGDNDDDDDIEFEDVKAPAQHASAGPVPSGDLELTLTRDTRVSLINPYSDKKGPTKRERRVRNATHCVHVLSLLWHNAVRNSWLCDPELQATLLSHLTPKLWEQVDRWRRSSGLDKPAPEKPSVKRNDRAKAKAKPKGSSRSKKHVEVEDHRDWGEAAELLEEGAVDMSHGDPLFRLMQYLAPWWRKRFRVDTPGLRKWGYMALERLDRVTKAHKSEPHDPDRFGEAIGSLEDLRAAARECRGSRDVGAQLFTALVRALGLEARMVSNLQVLGFGWSKFEDAEPEPKVEESVAPSVKGDDEAINGKSTPRKSKKGGGAADKGINSANVPRSATNGDTDMLKLEYSDSDDDDSVIELAVVSKRTPPTKKYDTDLEYPHYWTEVLSPVTKKYLPVDPVVKFVIATNRELTEAFEPRGAKADKSRQMMAYVVGYNHDGTAKDVTVRYLKRKLWPGRTKGVRLPPEKIPIRGKNGKVKRYEHFDWFKTALAAYRRGTKSHPLTQVDQEEDTNDLSPAQPEKRPVKEGEETLQYYKQSAEFVLERHLKREEALNPGAKPVKIFKNKSKGGHIEEEDVYRRADVLNVKSAETWHKQGRAPIPGEQPLKRVPYRAATINRKREIMESEAKTGKKVLQGLFSIEQTEWIIPPPIKDGVIPKNDYGNIDLFAEHMCPEGAIHIPYRYAVKVCKRLQIDYAEAVVDFEFGHRMAVPVIRGVVIATEHHDQVMEELEKDEVERRRKEDEKRRKAALGKWRKFLMGMRIVERIQQDYGHIDESVSVFGHSSLNPLKEGDPASNNTDDAEMGGGFLPEGYVDEEEEVEVADQRSGFFPVTNDDEGDDGGDDGLVMVDDRHQTKATTQDDLPKPSSPPPNPGPLPEAPSDSLSPPPTTSKRRGRPAKRTPAKKVAPKAPSTTSRGGTGQSRQTRQSARQREVLSYAENGEESESEGDEYVEDSDN